MYTLFLLCIKSRKLKKLFIKKCFKFYQNQTYLKVIYYEFKFKNVLLRNFILLKLKKIVSFNYFILI